MLELAAVGARVMHPRAVEIGELYGVPIHVRSSFHDGVVTTTPGFKEAFRQFAEGGWQGLQHPPEFGGQGLPHLIATPVEEMWGAANLAFKLCPMLTQGAIEAIERLVEREALGLRGRIPEIVRCHSTRRSNVARSGPSPSTLGARPTPTRDARSTPPRRHSRRQRQQ